MPCWPCWPCWLKLEGMVLAREKTILNMKTKLTSAEESKIRFGANADLATVMAQQYQKDSCLPIVAGLKEELNLLPKMCKMLENLVPKVDKLEGIPGLVKVLKEIADQASEKMRKHEELLSNMGDDSDMETAISLLERTNKVLELFGFSSTARPINVPETLCSLSASVLDQRAGQSVSAAAVPLGSGFDLNFGSSANQSLIKGNTINNNPGLPQFSHPPPPYYMKGIKSESYSGMNNPDEGHSRLQRECEQRVREQMEREQMEKEQRERDLRETEQRVREQVEKEQSDRVLRERVQRNRDQNERDQRERERGQEGREREQREQHTHRDQRYKREGDFDNGRSFKNRK